MRSKKYNVFEFTVKVTPANSFQEELWVRFVNDALVAISHAAAIHNKKNKMELSGNGFDEATKYKMNDYSKRIIE